MKVKELFNIAEQLRKEERFNEAIEVYTKIIEFEQDSSYMNAESAHMLGVVYYQQKKYDLADQILTDAEEAFSLAENTDMKAAVLRDRAMVALKQHNLEKSEMFLLYSIQLLSTTNNVGHLGISKVKLGGVLKQKGDIEKALELMLEGISDIKQSEDRFFESSAYYDLAQLFKEEKQLTEARTAAEHALSLLQRLVPEEMLYRERKRSLRQFIEELM